MDMFIGSFHSLVCVLFGIGSLSIQSQFLYWFPHNAKHRNAPLPPFSLDRPTMSALCLYTLEDDSVGLGTLARG